jgi:hypothetical protein
MDKDSNKAETTRSTIALIVSIIALALSIISVIRDYFYSGRLVVYAPTGYCIVRGYQDMGFPSDHLIIPFVIENTGNGVKTLQAPTLALQDGKGQSGHTFEMTGTIPDLYSQTMDDNYQIGFSVSVPGNSVREYYLVFHVENWWDENKPEAIDFHFLSGEQWQASLNYQVNGKKVNWQDAANRDFFTIPIYKTIDNLKYGGSYNSDCFPIEENTPGN